MNFNKFTTKSQEAIQSAVQTAEGCQHQAIEPLHLLLALVEQSGGIIPSLLTSLKQKPEDVSATLHAALEKLPTVSDGSEAYLTQDMKRILKNAESEAGKLRDDYISTEHLFLALLDAVDDPPQNAGAIVSCGLPPGSVVKGTPRRGDGALHVGARRVRGLRDDLFRRRVGN